MKARSTRVLAAGIILAAVPALVSSLTSPLPVAAKQTHTVSDESPSPKEITADLSRVAPEALASVAPVPTDESGADAIDATVQGTDLEVPVEPAEGVSINSAKGPAVDVGLPNAANADDALKVKNGLVAYDSNNGSISLVKAVADGSVAFLTLIDGPASPIKYRYPIDVSDGGRIRLRRGGAEILDKSGAVVSVVLPGWAKDANGEPIRTRYRVEGNSLVQYVYHRTKGVEYPVVADPWVRRWYGWDIEFNRRQTNDIMFGLAGATAASLFIPDPTVTKIVAAVLGTLTGYANWIYNRGGCLKLRVTYWTGVYPGHYFGGNCR